MIHPFGLHRGTFWELPFIGKLRKKGSASLPEHWFRIPLTSRRMIVKHIFLRKFLKLFSSGTDVFSYVHPALNRKKNVRKETEDFLWIPIFLMLLALKNLKILSLIWYNEKKWLPRSRTRTEFGRKQEKEKIALTRAVMPTSFSRLSL
jgi:hypothetical protein